DRRVDRRADLHARSLHALRRRADAAETHHALVVGGAIHGAHALTALGLLGRALTLGVAAECDVAHRTIHAVAEAADVAALEVLAWIYFTAPGPARRTGAHETLRLRARQGAVCAHLARSRW